MTPFRSDVLAGKRILVTGGGTGLGKEISRGLAQHGAHVFICGRREQVLKDACRGDPKRHRGSVDYRLANVRDAQSVDAMVADIWQSGPLTGLINNAAANFIAPTESLSPRAYEAVRSTVMDGSFFATLSCGKRWIAGGLPGAVRQQPRDVGLDRIGLCRAVGDGEDGHPRDDDVARGGVGAEEHPPQCRRTRAVSDRERVGEAQSDSGRGRRRHATRSGAAAPVWRDRRTQEPDDPVDVGCLQLHQRRDHRHRRRPSSCGAQHVRRSFETVGRRLARIATRASTGEERKGRGV